MTRMVRRTIRAAVLMALVAGALASSQAHAAPNCFDRQAIFAKLIQPDGGQVSVTSQAGVTTVTLPAAPLPVTPVMLSTTGEIEVKIDHQCMKTLRLTVTKDGNPTPVFDQTWETGCDRATHTVMVPIGLDGGTYQFQTNGTSCSGLPVRTDGRGGVVGDPPLPISL